MKTKRKLLNTGYSIGVLAISLSVVSCKHITDSEFVQRDNPLLGKIYQPEQSQFIDESTLTALVQAADVVLVGETHDNPEHHQRQIDIIKRVFTQGQTGLVALEMVTDTQMEFVLKDRPADASGLITSLKKEDDGWEYNKLYKDVFQAIYDSGAMVTSANLNRKTMVSIVMQGDDAIPPTIRSLLDQVALDEENSASLQKEIEMSHCGMMSGKHAGGMIKGQRVRDAYMAKAVVDAKSKADKVLLLAGSGHVRIDRGVPLYIKQLSPNLKVLSLGLAEVVDDHTDPVDYTQHWGGKKLPFDYVWFTRAVDRPDPCEELRNHFKKLPHANPDHGAQNKGSI